MRFGQNNSRSENFDCRSTTKTTVFACQLWKLAKTGILPRAQKPVQIAVLCSLFEFDTTKHGEYHYFLFNVQKCCRTHGFGPPWEWQIFDPCADGPCRGVAWIRILLERHMAYNYLKVGAPRPPVARHCDAFQSLLDACKIVTVIES